MRNPDIVEHGKGTRFGSGQDPNAHAKTRAQKHAESYDVRRKLKMIAGHDFDFSENAPPISEQVKSVFDGRMSGAAVLACRKFEQAMANYKAMDTCIEHICGKLVDKKVEAKVDYAQLVAGSIEEEKHEQLSESGDD